MFCGVNTAEEERKERDRKEAATKAEEERERKAPAESPTEAERPTEARRKEARENPGAIVDAAKEGDAERVRILARDGWDVDFSKEGDDGRTALYYAALNGRKDVVYVLIAAKADGNKARTDTGDTPLYVAAFNLPISANSRFVCLKQQCLYCLFFTADFTMDGSQLKFNGQPNHLCPAQ